MNTSVPDAPWCLHKLWTHGHVGVVRALVWDEQVSLIYPCSTPLDADFFLLQNETLVTGGEDGKLNIWPIKPVDPDSNESDDEDEEDGAMEVDPKSRKREYEEEGSRVSSASI